MPAAGMPEGIREQTGTEPLIDAERALPSPPVVSKITMHPILSQGEIKKIESSVGTSLADFTYTELVWFAVKNEAASRHVSTSSSYANRSPHISFINHT